MPKHRIEIFLGLTWANAIFSLCTVISVVALGKMGGGLDCKALPEASPALWGSLLEDKFGQENAENICCSLVMCNTRAQGSARNNRNCHAVSRNSQQCSGREEKATYRIILTWCLLPPLGKSLKTRKFHQSYSVCLLLITLSHMNLFNAF